MIAGVRRKELDNARSLGVSDVLAIDDDYAIENFRLVDAIADTVGGDVAAKLIGKVDHLEHERAIDEAMKQTEGTFPS